MLMHIKSEAVSVNPKLHLP